MQQQPAAPLVDPRSFPTEPQRQASLEDAANGCAWRALQTKRGVEVSSHACRCTCTATSARAAQSHSTGAGGRTSRQGPCTPLAPWASTLEDMLKSASSAAEVGGGTSGSARPAQAAAEREGHVGVSVVTALRLFLRCAPSPCRHGCSDVYPRLYRSRISAASTRLGRGSRRCSGGACAGWGG